MRIKLRSLTRAAILAAVYATLTIILAPISYGPFFQLRVAEALTILPFLTPVAIPALFLGCIIANVFGGLGVYDIVFGSLATLLSAFLTWKMPKSRPWLAPLPPVIVNAVVVGLYLSALIKVPAWITIGWVGLGELCACYGIGLPLLYAIRSSKRFSHIVQGR